jgi:hypothetical protein
MNIHFDCETLATIVAVAPVALLTVFNGKLAVTPETHITMANVSDPSNPSSPRLVTCGAGKNTAPAGKTSTIDTIPCGSY